MYMQYISHIYIYTHIYINININIYIYIYINIMYIAYTVRTPVASTMAPRPSAPKILISYHTPPGPASSS